MRIVIYHVGSIGRAIMKRLRRDGHSVSDYEFFQAKCNVDVAICTSGKMVIAHPMEIMKGSVLLKGSVLERMFQFNYLEPRIFTEWALCSGAKLVIHIGSNSARYGKSGAEDYAALKAALWKYCELRGKLAARESGARICCINLGGVVNSFWDNVLRNSDRKIAEEQQMVPERGKGLTDDDVAELVAAIVRLPDNIAVKDLLVVGTQYQ